MVLILYPVEDGTRVTVAAGNEENDVADVKNNIAEVHQQVAKFSDLRFVGKSGRGKNFNLTITVHRKDIMEVAIVSSVIKVTVDGPRDSRNTYKSNHYQPYSINHKRLIQPTMFPPNPMFMNPITMNKYFDAPMKSQEIDEATKNQLFLNSYMEQVRRIQFDPRVLPCFNQQINPQITPQFLQLLLMYQSMMKNNSAEKEKEPEVTDQKKQVWRPYS